MILCVLLSLKVLGLVIVSTLEEAIIGLNQSAEKLLRREHAKIITGSDYKTIWCPTTVHKTVVSLRKDKSKKQAHI